MNLLDVPENAEDLDIHIQLPTIAALDPTQRREVARFVRGRLRPALLRRLACSGTSHAADATWRLVDTLEARLRLQEVDGYASALQLSSDNAMRPTPSEDMPVVLRHVVVSATEASAVTELYYSPTTKSIAHGPDVLRFVLAIAAKLLEPGEDIAELLSAHWKNVVISNLWISVSLAGPNGTSRSTEDQHKASVSGALQTSAGRTFEFLGVQLCDAPIFEESGHNGCAFELFLSSQPVTDNGVTARRMHLASDSPWREKLNNSRQFALFILAELIGLAVGYRPSSESQAHLSVKVNNLRVPERLGEAAVAGFTLLYERNFNAVRGCGSSLATIPYQYQFAPFQTMPSTGLMAVTTLTVPELMAFNRDSALMSEPTTT